MKTLKKIGSWFANLFGFTKNSKYVSSYLNAANMRSGIYMAAIVIAIEIWMIIRQSIERVKPILDTQGGDFLQVFYSNTSNFWLFLLLALSMFAYCIYSGERRKRTLKDVIVVCSFAVVGLLLFAFIDYPSVLGALTDPTASVKSVVTASLLLVFFLSTGLFQLAIIAGTIYRFKGGKSEVINSVLVISLFALVCLSFGMMVSYSDYFGYAKDPVTGGNLYQTVYDAEGNATQVRVFANKQIICFLMMTLYVGCLLIWKPYISIGILGAVFLGFHLILVKLPGIDRSVQDGDVVNYITFFISLAMVCVSIYNQRVLEARKDEELEILATKDKLTDLWGFEYFLTLAKAKTDEVEPTEWMYLFFDVTSFKIYNDQRGFAAGNKFLKDVGAILADIFSDGLVSRQGDDHFVVFCEKDGALEKIEIADARVEKLDIDIKPGLKAGGYILKNNTEDPHRSVEKARYAFSELKNNYGKKYLEYDQKMHDSYHLIQYVVKHIDEAIENGYIQPYYQPVVWSNTKELCGCEALARWIDPRYGFMNPGLFIGALENAQLVHKVDIAMLTLVCKDLRYNMDHKLPVVPVSINFSRLDFMVLDIPAVIEGIVNQYKIPKHLIHVEITESALLTEGDVLKKAMKSLKEKGFAIWLDDFGSGYSSFNALKDYEFDVLKLDMQFLVGFGKNPKSRQLIKSVIQMAEEIGMKTLSEGVETEEQASFLNEISCGRLQGYLFGKPLSYEDLEKKIKNGELTISKVTEK